jgi:hypothetical protein
MSTDTPLSLSFLRNVGDSDAVNVDSKLGVFFGLDKKDEGTAGQTKT